MFAAQDRSLVAFSRDSFFEKSLNAKPMRVTADADMNGAMHIAIGDLTNSHHVCLPPKSGPQVATLTAVDTQVIYAEQRCNSSGTFSGSARGVTPGSLYGVNAYAVAFHKKANAIVATDRDGFLTVYQVPRSATAR
jgi:hypothetical protein